ncbi:MAG: UDP-N-acetylglucosamine diphosphorylase/glucosamine-1-phosphate N-acetyltransferase, partial [Actinobacteria bacterium]|nr:UDP-N-acetylglucosamine diphosphorylase/glucosamine-1-phosphate N-acetyltransferase [Actinomycetota bacterium]
LAAGQGTRMRSRKPKVLHDLCGRSLIEWTLVAAREAGCTKLIVVDAPERPLDGLLGDDVELVVQPQADGTAGAVAAALASLPAGSPVVILSGDVPLISAETIRELVSVHEDTGAAATVATALLEDPSGYGRVVRRADGTLEKIVETKTEGDATAEELLITEVNSGVYVFDPAALTEALPAVGTDNSQGERYLPAVLPLIEAAGGTVAVHSVDDPSMLLGANDRVDLAELRDLAQMQIIEAHLLSGVDIVAPASTQIDIDVEIGTDSVIEPFTALCGATKIGERSTIGPDSTLTDATIGDDVTVLRSHLTECEVRSQASIGPFSHLRPGSLVRERAKVGAFVELKNSDIGEGAKVPHLSYVGDAEVGAGANLGAGTITANYDGVNKHRTVFGERVNGGVHVSYIAPVEVGDDSWTAAGSVITEAVPPGSLAIGRGRQENKDGYDARRKRDAEDKK